MKVYRERTNLRVILIACGAALVGIVMLVISETSTYMAACASLQTLTRELGGLLFASVAVAILWELAGKRALVAEILATTRLAEELASTGLISVSAQWHGVIDWTQLFRTAEHIDIFFTYGRTWRQMYREQLRQFATRPGTSIRIVLPDPDDQLVISSLGRRLDVPTGEVSRRIRESAEDFRTMFTAEGLMSAHLEVRFVPILPLFGYYRFDNKAVFTLYPHCVQSKEVPSFVVERGGSLFEFFLVEFDGLFSEAPERRQ